MPLSVNSYIVLGTRSLGLAVDYSSVRFITQSGAYRVQGGGLNKAMLIVVRTVGTAERRLRYSPSLSIKGSFHVELLVCCCQTF